MCHSKFATIEKFLLTVPEIITLTKLEFIIIIYIYKITLIKNIAIINLSSIVAENSKVIFLIFTLVRFKGVGGRF